MDTGRAFCWKFISAAKSVAWWWAGGGPGGSAIKQIGEDAGNIRMRILTVNYLELGRRRPTGRVMGRGRWPSNCHMEMVVKGSSSSSRARSQDEAWDDGYFANGKGRKNCSWLLNML